MEQPTGAASASLLDERTDSPALGWRGRRPVGRAEPGLADRGLRTWPFRAASLKIWLAAWAGMFAVTTAVGLLIVHVLDDGPLGRLDRSIAFWFADQRTPRWNGLAQIGAGLADAYTLTPAVIILVFVLAAVFRRWHESLVLGAGILLEKAVFLPSTYLVDRPRPPVTQLDGNPPTSSFPSGHVAAAVVCYGAVALIVIWHTRSRWVHALACLVAGLAPTLVLVSRLELGMHHFSDVVWGVFAGAAALLFATWAGRAGADGLAARGAPARQAVLDPAVAPVDHRAVRR
jgi:undecaprenyl-diphosphatase